MSYLLLGCGYTGARLARRLQNLNQPVVVTARTEARATELRDSGLDAVVWQAPDPLPKEADVAVVLFPPRGLDAVAVAATLSGVPRVVYCSSTSVYGDAGGGEVTDHTPVNPISPWGKARVEAEDALRAMGAMIVRAAGIYGPGRNVMERLKAGRLRLAGDLSRPVNLIHVDDLCTILLAVAQRGRAGESYLAASGRPIPWLELAAVASLVTGIPLPPESPMPDDPNLRMFYSETKRCMPARLAELGVTLQHPDARDVLPQLHS